MSRNKTMKAIKTSLLTGVVVVLLSAGSAFANSAPNAPNPPSELMVELLTAPEKTVIYDTRPEFSWVVNDPDENEVQSAYQIQVIQVIDEESESDWDSPFWDSGKIESVQSAAVSYGGTDDLKHGKKYSWRVRTWDKNWWLGAWSPGQRFNVAASDAKPKFTYWGGAPTAGEVHHTTKERYPRHKTSHYTPVVTKIKPVSVTKIGSGAYFADFGKAAFGRLSFEIQKEGNKYFDIKVRLGELKEKGQNKIDMSPPGPKKDWGSQETDVIVSWEIPHVGKGWPTDRAWINESGSNYKITINPEDQKRAYEYRSVTSNGAVLADAIFNAIPFRYVEIHNLKQGNAADIKENMRLEAVHYPFNDDASDFKSSNDVLNQVWDLSKYTMKATSWLGVYVDGHRERRPYEGDSYIQQLGHYSLDKDAYSIARRSHEYFMDDPTWPVEWHAHSVLMAYADWMWTGDTESMSFYFGDLYARTQTLLRPDDSDDYYPLIGSENIAPGYEEDINYTNKERIRPVIDWPKGERDGYSGSPNYVAVPNAVHHGAMVRFRAMAEAMAEGGADIPGDALDKLKTLNKNHKEKFKTIFWNSAGGAYRNAAGQDLYALHSSAFAVAFGLSDPELEEKVTSFLLGKGMEASPYGAQYFLEALYKIGQGQKALNLLTSTQKRSWYNMLRIGSTITTEAWDFDYKDNMDLNHAWGAAPANIIPQQLMGVQPLAPGFSKIQIKPQTGNLEWAWLTMPTVKGQVIVKIKKNPESTYYTIVIIIPANTKAEVYVPRLGIRGDSEVKPTVEVDGSPDSSGILKGTHEDGGQFILFSDVGSGRHVFKIAIDYYGNWRPGPGDNFKKVSDPNYQEYMTAEEMNEKGYVWCAEKFCVPPGGEGEIIGHEIISCLGSGNGSCVTYTDSKGGILRSDGFIKAHPGYRRLFYRPVPLKPSVGLPSGDWRFCSREDEYCTLPGISEEKYCVQYGAEGYFNKKCSFKGGDDIGCNNSEFGDPIQGTRKSCFYQVSD